MSGKRADEPSKFLVFGSPVIEQAEIDEVVDSLRSGWIGSGPKVGRFERDLEAYVGAPHVRCVGSGTAALMLALRVLGIGAGDEVIVPSMTFVASANAVEHAGATTVLVDCDPISGLIDLDQVEAAINSRTAAVMPVHLYGRPVDMDRVNEIRNRHRIAVIEDAAHALGAEWDGRPIGNWGNLTAYSFYVTKNVTTGEGGALVSNDASVAERVERLALHGLSAGAWQRFSDAGYRHYEVVEPGFKFNMTDIQAALGIHQLGRLDGWIDRRAELWARYDQKLEPVGVTVPDAGDMARAKHARHLYPVLINAELGLSRDEVLARMTKSGIGTGVHYRAVHLHPYYRDKYGLSPGDFPVADDMSHRTVSLPLSPAIDEADQDAVIAALSGALDARS